MMTFEEFKKTLSSIPSDIDLFKLYEEYRKQIVAEEQTKTDKEEEKRKQLVAEAQIAADKTEEKRKQLEIEKQIIIDKARDSKDKTSSHKYDFLKYFLGTFILGAFTAYTTYIYKCYELKMQERKEDMISITPYMTQYLDILKNDGMKFDRAFYMAEFLSYTITESELKNGFSALRDTYALRIKVIKDSTNNIDSTLIKTKKDLVVAQNKQFSTQSPTSIDKKKNDSLIIALEQKLVNTQNTKNEILKEVSKTFDKPPVPIPIITPSDTSYEVISEDDRYTGKGYYSSFIDGIVVSVTDYIESKSKAEIQGVN